MYAYKVTSGNKLKIKGNQMFYYQVETETT